MISFKRKRFYREFLKDQNGTKAAIRAGFSVHTAGCQASQMMNDPEGLEYYFSLLDDLNEHIMMEAADVKNEIAKLASSDVRGIYHEDGTIKAPHELDDFTAAAIVGIKITQDPVKGDQYEYKFHPKMQALENLTKQFNLYEEHQRESAAEVHIHFDDKDAKA